MSFVQIQAEDGQAYLEIVTRGEQSVCFCALESDNAITYELSASSSMHSRALQRTGRGPGYRGQIDGGKQEHRRASDARAEAKGRNAHDPKIGSARSRHAQDKTCRGYEELLLC